jgi:hypothetical protein
VIPGFAKDVVITIKAPNNFSYYLYHGVWFEFRQSNNPLTIYLAINAIDLCLINYTRLQDRSAFRSVQQMVDSGVYRPFYTDLISNMGLKAIQNFEQQNKSRIDSIFPNIKFLFN